MTCQIKIASVTFGLFVILIFNFSTLLAQEKGVLSLSLNVISKSLPVNEAAVKFTSEGKEVELNVTQDNGRYTTIVPFGNEYLITIGKENLVPKIIKVDSRIPEKFKKAFFYDKIAIELFSTYDKNADQTVLHEPYAFVTFNEAASNFEVRYNQKIKKEDHKAKEAAAIATKKSALQQGPGAKTTSKLLEPPKHNEITDKIASDLIPIKEKALKTTAEIPIENKKENNELTVPINDKKNEALGGKENTPNLVPKIKKIDNSLLDVEEKAIEEKKRLELENAMHNKKIADAKASEAEEEARQLKIKAEIDKKILEEKNKNIQEHNRLSGMSQERDQTSDEAKERARKEAAENARKMEEERLRSDVLARQLSQKAKEDLRKQEEEEARLARIEDEKQALAKRTAKEAELAAKKTFEADLERKQKKLALEKDNRLKEKDIADLIVEYNTFPKGHTENFEGFKVFRIVKKENDHLYTLYKRTTYAFGVYYFQNNRSITKTTFEKETQIID